MTKYSDEDIKLNRKHALEALRNPVLPQAFGNFYRFDSVTDKVNGACALGVMHKLQHSELNTATEMFGADNNPYWYKAYGVSEDNYGRWANSISSLNDRERASLPDIADFIEKVYWSD